MRTALLSHLCLTLLLVPLPDQAADDASATGAESPTGPPTNFGTLDMDGDGTLSLAELQSGAPLLAARFMTLDQDGDGLLSPSEVANGVGLGSIAMPHNAAASFKGADRDGDGRLSLNEARQGSTQIAADFARLDADGDGFLTRQELPASQPTQQ